MAKEYTFNEVLTNTAVTENLIVINNEVFNVAPFLNEHPGGEEVLLDQRGKDATEAFEDVGHSTEARELMKKYKVGYIKDSDKKDTQNVSSKKFETTKRYDQENKDVEDNGLPSWLLPAVFGIVVVVIYQYFL